MDIGTITGLSVEFYSQDIITIIRSAVIVQYSFYKNIACFTNQLYYAFYTNFSNQTMFDGANLTGYNVAFTALPIFIFGLVGRNIPADTLLERPQLYRRIAGNKLLSVPEFLLWFLQGVWVAIRARLTVTRKILDVRIVQEQYQVNNNNNNNNGQDQE